jgi:hypothetical protein
MIVLTCRQQQPRKMSSQNKPKKEEQRPFHHPIPDHSRGEGFNGT